MKKLLLLLILCAFFMSGCETMNGLGKDFENAGRWLQQVSD